MAGSQCSFFVITSIVYAVTLLVLVSEVDATATLELHMERYDNPTSLNADGSGCDPLNNPCDHKFRFALDHGDSDDNPMGFHYWVHNTNDFQDQNTNIFGRDMAGIANPIITHFTTWPPIGVKFKVFVTDTDASPNPDDDIDSFVQLLRLTPAVNISVANWISAHMLGRRSRDKSTLTMKYKLYCDANYYSPDCSVKCVATETCTCDPDTGRIICPPGGGDGDDGDIDMNLIIGIAATVGALLLAGLVALLIWRSLRKRKDEEEGDGKPRNSNEFYQAVGAGRPVHLSRAQNHYYRMNDFYGGPGCIDQRCGYCGAARCSYTPRYARHSMARNVIYPRLHSMM